MGDPFRKIARLAGTGVFMLKAASDALTITSHGDTIMNYVAWLENPWVSLSIIFGGLVLLFLAQRTDSGLTQSSLLDEHGHPLRAEPAISKRNKISLIFVLFASVIAAGSGMVFFRGPSMYKEFAGIPSELKRKLGRPTQKPYTLTLDAYQAKHTKAMVVFVGGYMFQIPANNINHNWIAQQGMDTEDRPELRTDAGVRKIFPGIKPNPPFSGVAQLFLSDAANWEWIGGREWHCYLDSTQVHFQRFERGYIIGGLRSRYENYPDLKRELFVLTEDGKWTTEKMPGAPPVCKVPEDDKH